MPTPSTDEHASPTRPVVEVGWLVTENLEAPDREAIKAAHQRVTEMLAEHLPEFEWRTPLAVQEAPSTAGSHEAVEHLGWAREQRDLRGWDYVFAFVAPDLIARQRDHAWECVSRSLDSAVISTARIDPRAQDPDVSQEYRVATLADRLVTLVLRGLAHLCGVPEDDSSGRVMSGFQAVGELEQAAPLAEEEWARLRHTLRETADPRLEETADHSAGAAAFYLRAGWRNRREVLEAVRQARPWQMPLRLARLTIAAVSTMLVLIMTAEAWELGVRQPLSAVAALTGVSLVVTVVYVLVRQGLLLSQGSAGLSEQVVTTNLTTIAIIATGIATTYVCLYLLTLLVTASLFDAELVASWAPTLHERADWECYATFAGFVSSIGIVIGALGVSFEGQHYFRHITYVDEEV
ncbi:hypothetical protein Pla123a_06750 [Posidoniimonas polymericola]|uniref:Uncharacterized protein n=1 Tax=Posidoniimonas polymericola TaxID=2528002 RepID=A0A5C5ZFA9_9BACT|nr:hypothetical protein [Posidoniimonas polymericola]TWT85868.1 hypothetical protein Pla123a_06750 [Posidoniimonas polymericola]